MYEAYWQLTEPPFDNSPNPKFFYLSPEHEEALVRLVYVVQQRKGCGMLTGEYGCGKTLLSANQVIVPPMERPEDGAKQGQRLRIRRHHRARQLSDRHEHGVPRRVRLMLRGIEIVKAEREILRVDVFERRRKKQEMRDEEDHREH